MSFSCSAKRARNPAEPLGHRASAVRSCVERYRPLGFHATVAFLESQVGSPLRWSETAILGALELLEHSRLTWRTEKEEFAAARHAAKQAGQRSLPGSTRNVVVCDRWHADPLAGALFVADHWRRQRRPELGSLADLPVVGQLDPLIAAVGRAASGLDAASDLVTASDLSPASDLGAQVTALRASVLADPLWETVPLGYRHRSRLLFVLRQLAIAVEHFPDPGSGR